jgi:prevent-host-death family protein
MRAVNVKELKARLSAYLREVERGETFLVTDRGRVVGRLGPLGDELVATPASDALARLAALGARLPVRERRPSDYARAGPGPRMTPAEIDALLDDARRDRP